MVYFRKISPEDAPQALPPLTLQHRAPGDPVAPSPRPSGRLPLASRVKGDAVA